MQSKRTFSSYLYNWIRELHLYIGLFISPFVLVFAFSTILFNHTWKARDTGPGAKSQQEKIPIEIPENVEGLEFAKHIMRQVDVSGEIEFFRYQPSRNRFVIPVMKPGQRVKIKVDLENKTAEITKRRTGFWNELLYLHKSPGPHLAGFRGNWFFTRLWGWLADATVYLLLFVSASGVYIWSLLKAERKIGLILLGAGCLSSFLIVFVMVR